MRLQLIPLIVAIIVNVGVDALILAMLRKAVSPKWLRSSHMVLSALLLLLIIVANSISLRIVI